MCLLGSQCFSTYCWNGMAPSERSNHEPAWTCCSSRLPARSAARRDECVPAERMRPSGSRYWARNRDVPSSFLRSTTQAIAFPPMSAESQQTLPEDDEDRRRSAETQKQALTCDDTSQRLTLSGAQKR